MEREKGKKGMHAGFYLVLCISDGNNKESPIP